MLNYGYWKYAANNKRKRGTMKKGFTLIELLVVVLIIGILAGVAVVEYKGAIKRARVLKGIPLGRAIQTAMDEYAMAGGGWSDVQFDMLTFSLPDGATDGDGNPYSKLPAKNKWICYDFGKADMRCYQLQSGDSHKKDGRLQYKSLYRDPANSAAGSDAEGILYFYSNYSGAENGAYNGWIRCTYQTGASKKYTEEFCQMLGGTKMQNNSYRIN